ncbi:hypothetical protein K449DRAFT_469075 [Hypoxylon sp. EC38]|nr:hypothetical protein K449DRAFT_469075 [Hypoxylon sp. EC38]
MSPSGVLFDRLFGSASSTHRVLVPNALDATSRRTFSIAEDASNILGIGLAEEPSVTTLDYLEEAWKGHALGTISTSIVKSYVPLALSTASVMDIGIKPTSMKNH